MRDYYVNIKWLVIVIPILGIGSYEIFRELVLNDHFEPQTNSLILIIAVGLFGFFFTSWLIKSIQQVHNNLFCEQSRLKSILHYTSDGIVILDENLTIIDINPAMEKLTGWKAKDVIGKFSCDQLTKCSESKESCWNTLEPDICMGVDCGHRECWGKACFQKQISIPYVEMCIISASGKKNKVAASYSYIPSFGELKPQVKIVLRDVSERKDLEKAIENYATLEERYRLAREIHDGLAQALVYINIKTYNLEKRFSNKEYDYALEEIKDLRSITKDVVNDVRQNIFDLKTPLQEENSCFKKWLEKCLEEYSSFNNLNCEICSNNITHLAVPAEVKVQLVRVIQEALTNIRKHAQANKVVVNLEKDDRNLIIQIKDDGIGINMEELNFKSNRHFGITIMKERIRSVGGRLYIDSSEGLGTSIQITLPNTHLAKGNDNLA